MSKKELTFEEVLEHFTPDDLLAELGYIEEICFQDWSDLGDYVVENSDAIGVELKEDFEFNILQEDLHNRFLNLLDRISYNEIDNFLKKYE